jgi:16S rRNA (cytidine1402-2'-O)-methyltransferase
MSTNTPSYGRLYLIPTTLGDNEPLEVLPISIKRTIESIDHYIVENEKSARHFIKKISSGTSQSGLQMLVLNKFTDPEVLPTFLEPCLLGKNVGIISEAGCPGIADPGADIVHIAHRKGIQVVPLVGPSSILLSLMASGLNGQNFAFNGYLPIEGSERKSSLKKLERISREHNQTQICIETPYRNDKLFSELTKTLSPGTLLCVASEITLASEYIATKFISEWKGISLDLHKKPTIFLFQA